MNRVDHLLAAFGLSRVEQRDADPRLAPDAWSRAFPSSAFSNAGGVESNIPTALACVNLQATVLAGLPFAAYRRGPDGGRERIRDGSLSRLIDAPNQWQSRFDLMEALVRALHWTGNFYAEVTYGRDGLFESIRPLSNSAVTTEQTTSGAVRLRVSEPGRSRVLVDGEYLHVRMPGHNATDIVGISTVQRARGALGLSLELNRVMETFAKADLKSGGYIIQPADTNARAKRNKRDDMADQEKDHPSQPKILDLGAKYVPVTMTIADSQILESRQFSAQDTARIFSTPPGMVGIQQTQSYGSQQQDAQNFVTVCIGPLANRIESAFERCLLSAETRQEVFFEFSLDGLLRTDPGARFQQYQIGRNTGLYSPNDLRKLENLPPRTDPGGDAYDDANKPAPAQAEPPIARAK